MNIYIIHTINTNGYIIEFLNTEFTLKSLKNDFF